MSVLVALTTGLVFWLCGWAFGFKAFDTFMVAALLTVTAATARLYGPYVRQMMGRERTP